VKIFSRADVANYFVSVVGTDKAEAVVRDAMNRLHVSGNDMPATTVLSLLEDIATSNQDIIGIAARFAKARVLSARS
jgi:hypothetical protein